MPPSGAPRRSARHSPYPGGRVPRRPKVPSPGLSHGAVITGVQDIGKVPLSWDDVACLGSQLRRNRSTSLVKKRCGCYPGVAIDGQGLSVVPNAGSVVLLHTAEAIGLTTA